MKRRSKLALLFVFCILGASHSYLSGQTQTSGRIAGTIRDAQGAVIIGAEVVVENPATAEKHSVLSDSTGNYSVLQLPPATYQVDMHASGFTPATYRDVSVGPSATTTINAVLQIARGNVELTVTDTVASVRSDSSELASTIDAPLLEALPLPSRNLLQLLTIAPGVSAPLTNNNAIGRNSPNVSVNGARLTQNSYQINGVDSGDVSLHALADVAVPAPETVSNVNVATSMYDATSSGAGGDVQIVTKNGTNAFHGGWYEYFRNEALNANDANLKAAGERRPVMRRNVYGALLGGPIRKDRAFFFASYQGSREANGATDQSLYKDVLIAPGLTDDRSATTLMATFRVPRIDPISLHLLTARLPNGQFLIPTPQTPEGVVTGTALSTFHEEQFNANVDYRLGANDTASAKFFLAHAPLFSAISGSNFGAPASLPGFGTNLGIDNRVLSVQEIHTFTATAINEGRFGYNFIRHDEVPQEVVRDSAIGMQRSDATQYPGLPLILLARDQGGASIGTSDITYRGQMPSLSGGDTLSLQRRKHNLRVGGEFRHSEWRARAGILSYGEIDFPTFQDFLIGNTGFSQFLSPPTAGFAHLGTGLPDRNTITTDYHFFVQDDWRISSKLSLNLALRYELDLPPYDSAGRIGGFDPELYQPRLEVAGGFPVGPPAGGIIEAGNAPPQDNLPGVTRVGKRLLKSIDPNNLGPRIGIAWSPLSSGRLALRAGYGIFYARPSFIYLGLQYFAPPFFLVTDTSGQPFNNPFGIAPPDSSFPLVQPGSVISAEVIDRNARTPYVQQFNASVQYELSRNTTLQIAYVGSGGVKLFRGLDVNQAKIASLAHPIVNAVTGFSITDNTIENTSLRAPMQGVDTAGFTLNESSAQSTYYSLQATFKRQVAHGLQIVASYTFSRSIDDASNPGGGANTDGSIDRSAGLDTGNVWGNQLNARSNRGLSDFDRTHYLVLDAFWNIPEPNFAHRFPLSEHLLSSWQVSTIIMATSGLPVDIFDPAGGSLYGLFAGARPNWATGANRSTAVTNVPAGYYFNPSAFTEAVVKAGEVIPTAHDATALAGDDGTDLGNVGRNVLRGPVQSNVDFSLSKNIPVTERKSVEFRVDFFNLLNHANRDNPVSDISNPNFGRVLSFSSSPRITQFAIRLYF